MVMLSLYMCVCLSVSSVCAGSTETALESLKSHSLKSTSAASVPTHQVRGAALIYTYMYTQAFM